MPRDAFPLPSLERLPSGRHRLSRAAVHESQRSRLLFAVVQVIAQRGYGATTVADIVERAAVSRSTFYAQFADKEACFLTAFSAAVEYVLSEMREARAELGPSAGWRAHLRSDLGTYTSVLAGAPAFARALHLEVLAAGPAALEHRARMLAVFARRMARLHRFARRQSPGLPVLAPEVFALHTGGVDEMIREWLRTRPAEALPRLAPGIERATVVMFGAPPSEPAPSRTHS